jgi:hypothetical protein
MLVEDYRRFVSDSAELPENREARRKETQWGELVWLTR